MFQRFYGVFEPLQVNAFNPSTTVASLSRQTGAAVIEDKALAPNAPPPEPATQAAKLIGAVETGADGTAGIVVAASVVGYVPPGGLMVQVRIEPTDPDKETAAEAATRPGPGEAPDAASLAAPLVRLSDELSDAEKAVVAEMQARDASVRREEQAHAAAAGSMAGPIQYEYSTGPDGRR